jgi:hypothetical protein
MSVKSMDGVGLIIKGVAAIYALFPGLAVALHMVEIPPSLGDLVKIIAFSVSGTVIIAVFLLDRRVRRISNERAVLLSVGGVVVGGMLLIGYFWFATAYTAKVVDPPGVTTPYIVPMHPTAEIVRIVHPANGYNPTIFEYERAMRMETDRARLKKAVGEENIFTVIVMILLLVFSEVLLIAPVVMVAWKLAGARIISAPSDARPEPAGGG